MLANFLKKQNTLKTDVILHVFLLFSFLILFLHFVIIPMTAKEFNNISKKNVKILIDKNKQRIKQKPERKAIFSFLEEYFNNNDPIKILSNKFMWTIVLFSVITLFIILCFTFVPYFTTNNSNLLKIIGKNIVILSLVGVFEILFFLYVLRSEGHMSQEEVKNLTQKDFSHKFNKMLEDPENYEPYKKANTIGVIIVISLLILSVVLIPMIWFGYDSVKKAIPLVLI